MTSLVTPKKGSFWGELEAQDWDELAGLIKTHVLQEPDAALSKDVTPAPYYPQTPTPELTAEYEEARALGEELLRAGEVAAFTVAAVRARGWVWDGPKGTFPATPIRETPLFGVFAEYIRKVGRSTARRRPGTS